MAVLSSLLSPFKQPDVGTFAWAPVVDTNFTVPGDEWYEEWEEKDWRIIPEMPLNFYQRNHHHRNLRYMAGVNRDAAANFVFNDNRLVRNRHEVSEEFFNERVKDWVKHYNYSLNMEGAYDAIKWMYTYGPDPHNTTHIREEYVHVSICVCACYLFTVNRRLDTSHFLTSFFLNI
ncbi:hypothetical protein E2C01_031594 [Portunus trituberculatus]|uniref:Carboxylesterase type B domain-containing protein n=1 Tax=Portunus trituberculatus TaxID=210409 RepID=A0A5B7EUY8_PORTR|nr:hypothetical protein [Portunus trituberculatus]